MPRISYFFGIVIYMYYDDHNPPHFHALYEGSEALFDFDGNLIKGFITGRVLSLVQECCGLHKRDLGNNRQLTRDEKPLDWIEPLR